MQVTEVTQLIKQYDQMKPMMEGLSGKGMKERLKSIREMQQSAVAPGQEGGRKKRSTGKRLSSSEKKKNRKSRMKKLKRLRGR